MDALPPFAVFPPRAWRGRIPSEDWGKLLDAWHVLSVGHLSLPDAKFGGLSARDPSIPAFLCSLMQEVASGGVTILATSRPVVNSLLKQAFLLTSRLLQTASPPESLTQWQFLADLARVYGKTRSRLLLSSMAKPGEEALNRSLSALKKSLVKNLDGGLHGDLKTVGEHLHRLNALIHVSPPTAAAFLAGSDFLDGLINCYKVMNPPLRSAIITTTYLCLMGLVDGDSPKMSLFTDQLYSLKTAAETHKAGPLNVNDSLVAELVTSTPLLQQVRTKLETLPVSSTQRAKAVLTDLAAFRKAGGLTRPKRRARRAVDKGKGLAASEDDDREQEMHVYRMGQVSQVQDLFPELGSAFVLKLLDEYAGDNERVIAHLLDDSLPSHLKDADRSEQL